MNVWSLDMIVNLNTKILYVKNLIIQKHLIQIISKYVEKTLINKLIKILDFILLI